MSDPKQQNTNPLVLPEIINRPRAQPIWQRGFFALVTSLAWLLWFYLFIPLFTLIGWFVGLQLVGTTLEDQYINHSTLFLTYGVIILASGIVLITWALYNYWRFRGVDRRLPLSSLRKEDLAQSFDLQSEQVGRMHEAQIVRIWHNESGDVARLEVDKLLPPNTE